MSELMSSYQEFDLMLQVFWGVAIVASLVFVILFVLTIIGLDHSDVDIDLNADGDGTMMETGDGLNIFTIKNFIGFLMGFGWAGVCLYDSISSPGVMLLVASVVGCLFVAMFVLIYKQSRKLDKDGTFNINDTLGKTASVYLRIPAEGRGKGKIQVSINGSVHEIDAVTDEDEIPTGRNVRIVEVIDNETLKVENNQQSLVI
ncbi:MAG: serine protease [Bacteroidaceae bacterium]|nr:serine protease [Bacteroidaceae bacterium]